MLPSYADALKNLEQEYRKILNKIPMGQHEELPPDWLHWQILERFTVLKHANIRKGSNILEIGCGPHAIATTALAALVGENGRVIALDIGRWKGFWKTVKQSDLASRVIPIQEDARKLPFPFSCFDLVACIHGLRSFESKESILEAIKEMLRVTRKEILIVGSSPIARTKAQQAHLAMYNLRHPTFKALGHPEYGDIHYLTTEELRDIATKAGATKITIDVIEVGMPHHLTYFPLDYIEKIEEKEVREDLKKRWKDAERMLEECGEEHPPVIVMTCWK